MLRSIEIKIFVAVCLTVMVSLSAQGPVPEYKIKAGFIYNFMKFVHWPPDQTGDPSAPITVGILGDDPFGASIEKMAGRTVRGRPVRIIHFSSIEDLEATHVLFISSSMRDQIPQILEDLHGFCVLTISEINDFCEEGGIITFIRSGEKIRFEINANAADRIGLRISSKLLNLAKLVGN